MTSKVTTALWPWPRDCRWPYREHGVLQIHLVTNLKKCKNDAQWICVNSVPFLEKKGTSSIFYSNIVCIRVMLCNGSNCHHISLNIASASNIKHSKPLHWLRKLHTNFSVSLLLCNISHTCGNRVKSRNHALL